MEIKQVDECSFGGPNSDFKEDSNDSKKRKNKLNQLLRVIKAPNHPK
jgi:DNA polymerase II large subunit